MEMASVTRMGSVRSSRLGRVTGLAPLLVGALLSLAAFGAIALLVANANDSRNAKDRLDEVTVAFNNLQGLPWEVITPGGGTAAEVRVEIAANEREISIGLARLHRDSPVAPLRGIDRLVARNFGMQALILTLLARGQVSRTGPLGAVAYRSHAEVIGAFTRASEAYDAQAAEAVTIATVGSGIAVLVMLSAFGFFHWRSVRSRARAAALTAALQESEAHLARAQEIAEVGSWEWRVLDGRVHLNWSAQQSRMHGWNKPRPPRTLEDVIPLVDPDDVPRLREALRNGFRDGEQVEIEYRAAGRLIHLQGGAIRGARGEPVGMIGTCQDVTERFRRAEAERANRAKDEFLSRTSHELRTPLNAILGFAQLLEHGGSLDDHDLTSVRYIRAAGTQLLDLINEMLDISRIESGSLRLSPEPVQLRGVIGEAVDLLTPLAADRNVAIVIRVDDELFARADMQRLKQVLLNLLSNAIKYNHEGGQVSIAASAAGDQRVRIEVTDNGPGIDALLLEKLFLPFERLGAEGTSVEGTGLGLAVSKGIVEAMDGTIGVHSRPGHGSRFTVELVAAKPALVAQPLAAITPLGISQPSRRSVVYIEDNASNRMLVEHIFRARRDIGLRLAADGESGLRMIREGCPDVVLLDLNLADIHGEEILRQLKADPATRKVPIIIVTADASDGQRERVLALGARHYLTKPLEIPELLRVIDDVLSDGTEQAA